MDYVRTEVVTDKYTDDENSDVLSEFQGSVLWTKRSLLYRLSFLSLLLVFALFLLGFGSPFWMTKHQVDKYRGYYNFREKVDVSIGLWRVCEGTSFSDITDCTGIPDITHYIVVCQTLLCLCLIFTVFSLIFGMYENCATRYDVDDGTEVRTKRPEINAVSAGIFGLAGTIMYGTSIIEAISSGNGAVHWAFLVTAGSVIGMIVCGIIMAITNPVHAATHSFSGQSMNLSRQNSLKAGELSFPNRLASSGDSLGQACSSQTSGTTYGGTGSIFDVKSTKFLKRSQSCLSPHRTSVSMPTLGLNRCDSQTNTYIVETRDIHTRKNAPSRKSNVKLYNKAMSKKSWAFDDTSCNSDLMSAASCDVLCEEARVLGQPEAAHSHLSSLPDALNKRVNSKGTLIGQTRECAANETADLMILDDPLDDPSAGRRARAKMKTKDGCAGKRTTNSLMEDNMISSSEAFSDLQRSTASAGSWENKPWPDPPTENETKEVPGMSMSTNKSSNSDSQPARIQQETKLKNTPESNQFQSHSKKHCQPEDSNISYKSLKSNDSNVKFYKSKGDRELVGKKSATPNKPLVPVRQEYDNPLFKAQHQDREQSECVGGNLTQLICESTALALQQRGHPLFANYCAASHAMQSKTPQQRTSAHATNTSRSHSPDSRLKNSTELPNGVISESKPRSYKKFSKDIVRKALKKSLESKAEFQSSNAQQKHANPDTKSRYREKTRSQQHAESGQQNHELMQQHKLMSQAGQQSGGSPQLGNRQPRLGPRKRDAPEPRYELEYDHAVPKGKVLAEFVVIQKSHGSNMNNHCD